MSKVYLLSLGCPKNLVDAEVLSSLMTKAGLSMVADPSLADVMVVTTCAFIRPAIEDTLEAIFELAEMKDKHQKLVVVGCLVERYKEKLLPLIPEVDSWVGFGALKKLPLWLKQGRLPRLALKGPGFTSKDYLERQPSHPVYAYLKIAEGCSNCCSFCTIPSIRGPLRSRPLEDIVLEAQRLVETGIKEIILVAQETTAYGLDIYGKPSLGKLLMTLDNVGVPWIRVLYAHPRRLLSLITPFKKCHHLVPYLDVPIQHVDDQILKKMKRGMSEKALRDSFKRFKEELPHVSLRSTVMVGFPGETKEAFAKLLDFLEEIRFDHLGVFKYYAEEGTTAYKWGNPIDEELKEQRVQQVLTLQYRIIKEKHQRLLSSVQNALIERIEEGQIIGRTAWQAPEIDTEVYVKGEANPGDFISVKIVDTYDYDLIGVKVK